MSKLDVNDLKVIDEWLLKNIDTSIKRIQKFIQHPSITSDKKAVSECAKHLKNLLMEVGSKDVRLIETEGNPIVYGEFPADSPFTLLVYMMYDTQPITDEKAWDYDPFGGEIFKTKSGHELLFGRGAINSKGPLIAFINSIDALLKTTGKLPVNLKIVCDGEEEIGSPNFIKFVKNNKDLLDADAGFSVTPSGGSTIFLGDKGILVLELECDAKKWRKGPIKGETHSKFKPILDSPVWHLIKALATLVDYDENQIMINGFYDKVTGPNRSEKELIKKLSKRVTYNFLSRFGPLTDKFGNLEIAEIVENLLYLPSINISSIKAGHSGEQMTTIIPDKAKCTIDIRFVPKQDGEYLLQKIKEHLKTKGYEDITIKELANIPWSRGDIDAPITQAILKSYNDMGFYPEIWPSSGASGGFLSVIQKTLQIQWGGGGLCSGGKSHGANEHIVLKSKKRFGLFECEKSYVSILNNYSILSSQQS